MKATMTDVKELLDEKYFQFNNRSFIETDPISIPHQFSKKEDIEKMCIRDRLVEAEQTTMARLTRFPVSV